MNFKKIGMVFTSKFVGTGPSSYEKRIYRAAVPQRLRNTGLWSAENPQELHENLLRSLKLVFWCSLSRKQIVGPLFLNRQGGVR